MGVGSKRPSRGKGEGSVYLRQDGRWVAELSFQIGTKRRRSTKYCKTKKQAQDALLVLRNKFPRTLTPITFSDWRDQWLEHVRTTCRSTTALNYERTLAATEPLSRLKISAIDADTLRLLYATVHGSPHAKYTLHTVVKACLNEAWRRDLIAENPARKIRMSRPASKPVKSLTVEQAHAFIAAIRGDRYEAIYLLAIFCGMNMAEILGLRWRNVDLVTKVVHVRQQVVEMTNGIVEADAPVKRKSRRRDIALAGRVYDVLHALASRPHDPDALVFTDSEGKPMRRTNFTNRDFHPLQDRAGIPRFNFHRLRHSTASILKAVGVDELTISRYLGHANTQITEGVYIDLFMEAHREAAERLAARLG